MNGELCEIGESRLNLLSLSYITVKTFIIIIINIVLNYAMFNLGIVVHQ